VVGVKRQRQAAILKVVRSGKVSSQKGIADALRSQGFDVSQTTVSRDLTELGLTRLRDSAGARYAEAAGASRRPADDSALRRTAPQVLLTVEPAGNIVVVKTQPGNAQGLAWAIDAATLPGVVGTVGGDDTILVVCADAASGRKVGKRLMKYALEQG
jgi:transcriptional regulator of arginine metabolism